MQHKYQGFCLSCGNRLGTCKMESREAGIRSLGDKCSWCGETGLIAYVDASKKIKVTTAPDGTQG